MSIISKIKEKFNSVLSNDIGIDLGTANTLVYVENKGIIFNEPSIVALNKKTDQIVAIGEKAKKMLGRSPKHITVIRPLIDGVISDFEITEEMLNYLINKAQENSKKMFGPRVVVGVPSGITNVEIRAVRDATKNAGAREVYIIEEPMAAAIGSNLPVKEPIGNMIIDIGGGTSDLAVISLGGIVCSKNLRIAGDKFSEDIIVYIREKYKILIGEQTAELIKTHIGIVFPEKDKKTINIKGRDLVTGLPKEIKISNDDAQEALSQSIEILLDATKEVLESAPPEIVSDIINRGIFLAGGGALIKGLDKLINQHIKVPVHIADEPLTAVARGAGVILENLDDFKDILIEEEDDI
jgi:rod shape-determining protein MreB and related proteins